MDITETLKEWGMMLCAVSVSSLIMYFLIPAGNMQKTVKTVLSILVLSVMFFPAADILGKNIFNIDDNKFQSDHFDENFSVNADQYILSETERIASEKINDILSEICTRDFLFDINIGRSGDNIILNDIKIRIAPEDSAKADEITQKIGEITGIIPELKTGETDE